MIKYFSPSPWKSIGLKILANVNGKPTQIAKINQMPCIGGSSDVAAEHGRKMEQANLRLMLASPKLINGLQVAVILIERLQRKHKDAFGWATVNYLNKLINQTLEDK